MENFGIFGVGVSLLLAFCLESRFSRILFSSFFWGSLNYYDIWGYNSEFAIDFAIDFTRFPRDISNYE